MQGATPTSNTEGAGRRGAHGHAFTNAALLQRASFVVRTWCQGDKDEEAVRTGRSMRSHQRHAEVIGTFRDTKKCVCDRTGRLFHAYTSLSGLGCKFNSRLIRLSVGGSTELNETILGAES